VTTTAGSTAGFADGSNGTFTSPKGIAKDSAGNIYIADASNHRIRMIDTTGIVTTLAGSTAGFADGVNGQFNSPQGISLSGSNIYVADTGNNRIRMFVPGVMSTVTQLMVTTLAGSTQGFADGQGVAAQLYNLNGLAFDSAGNIYLADTYNNRIRKIDTSSNVITVAGSTQGFVDAQGIAAQFYQPTALIVDSTGNIYVADSGNNRIRKIDTASNVTTVAGSTAGFADGSNGLFSSPKGISLSGSNIYVADTGNNRIRMFVPGATTTVTQLIVTTLAGSTQGFLNAQGSNAQFYYPFGVAVDSAGIVYVADTYNNRIRKIDTSSNVTTLAGSTQGFLNGQGIAAQFYNPNGVAVDSAGIVYVADTQNNRIRKIDTASNVTTLAGSTLGFTNAQGTSAQFFTPLGIAIDSTGIVYVADQGNNRIRKIDTSSNVTTLAGSTSGFLNAQGTSAQFFTPTGIAIDSAGILYVTDTNNNRIRKIDTSSNVTTLAGGSTIGFADGQGTAARFNGPNAVAVDSAGIVYVADTYNSRIRKIDTSSNVTTLAGSTAGFLNGQGTSAQFAGPFGVAVDSAGIVYVADFGNNRIRKIAQQSITVPTSLVTTVAGSNSGFADGQGTSALFNSPQGISLSGSNIYVADTGNNRIRLIDASSNVTTVAGSTAGFADGSNGLFTSPQGISLSGSNIYVADTGNNRIRLIDASSNVTTVAGSNAGFSNGTASNALFSSPGGILTDGTTIYVADTGNNRIRKIANEQVTSSTTVITTVAGSNSGFADGQGTSALFNSPQGISLSGSNIYVADTGNNRIRKIDTASNVTTVAGSNAGFADGTSAQFSGPQAISLSGSNIYVADTGNNRIRLIDASSNVTTVAGSNSGFADGQGTSALFTSPQGISLSGSNIYVADTGNNRIRKITSTGLVTTVAGSNAGFSNGPASNALFSSPGGIIADGNTIYTADTGNNRIRMIALSGVSTSIGFGYISTQTMSYTLGTLSNIYTSKEGLLSTTTSLLSNDSVNTVSTVQGLGQYYISTAALTSSIAGVQASSASNQAAGYISTLTLNSSVAGLGTLGYISTSYYISSFSNLISSGPIGYASSLAGLGSLGIISTATLVSTVEGLGTLGYISSSSPLVSTVQGLGQTYISTAVLVSTLSNYISTMSNYPTSSNQRLIDVDPAISTNTALNSIVEESTVTTLSLTLSGVNALTLFTGTALLGYTPPVIVTSVTLSIDAYDYISGLTMDSSGNVYYILINSFGIDKISKVSPNGSVITLAGSTRGFADGQGTSAQFNSPQGLAVDSAGIVYVADTYNNRIRKIDTSSNVTTLAGSTAGFADGQGTSARFNVPIGITVDSAGIIYVADANNVRIRKIDTSSNVTTLAGTGSGAGGGGYLEGPGSNARFSFPRGVAVDTLANVYVTDSVNAGSYNKNTAFKIRKIDTYSNVTTFAGRGNAGFSNAQGSNALFSIMNGIVIDSNDNLYIADTGNNQIRKIDTYSNVTNFGYTLFNIGAIGIDKTGKLFVASGIESVPNTTTVVTLTSNTVGPIISTDRFIYYANTTTIRNASLTTYSNIQLFSNANTYGGITNDSINIYATCGNSILAYSIQTSSTTIIANTNNTASFLNGTTAATVTFNAPKGIAIDTVRSNLYVCDTGNNSIRKVQLNPLSVTTLATITSPLGITVDSYSTYAYVTDTAGNITKVSLLQSNMSIRIASNLGTMNGITLDPTNTYAYVTRYTANQMTIVNLRTGKTTTTGSGAAQSINGTGSNAAFFQPSGIVYTSSNTLYIAETGSGAIRETTTQVYISTLTGLSGQATATTIAPITTLTNQVTGQFVYLSNATVTTTPFISLTPTTLNITADIYANTVTSTTFTASSGTSASGLGYFFGDGTHVTTISDIRTKENIEPIENALSTVRSLQAVEYTKIDDLSRRWLGYIAQDVEHSIPEIVSRSGEEEWRSIQYTNLPGLIIEAIKELKQKYQHILDLVNGGQL
jgi:DNA-binding beta-propeller fold protein YncE